jgi:hypothetical protein
MADVDASDTTAGHVMTREIDGTITFATSTSTATFSFAAEVTFAAGDRLSVIAPASPDPSLADLSITFNGRRT